jgi:nitrogen fixation protein FixH
MATITAGTWRNFPRYMILAMGLVVAVNVRFIYIAVATFPGAASSDDFDTSNRYNTVLAAVAAQDALGWSERASAQGAVPVVDLTGPGQRKLADAQLVAQAERPLGNSALVDMSFAETSPGHYVGSTALPAPGQWDLRLQITQGAHHARVTRRILIK